MNTKIVTGLKPCHEASPKQIGVEVWVTEVHHLCEVINLVAARYK